MRWSGILARFSGKTIDELEAKLVEGELNELQALQLLQLRVIFKSCV